MARPSPLPPLPSPIHASICHQNSRNLRGLLRRDLEGFGRRFGKLQQAFGRMSQACGMLGKSLGRHWEEFGSVWEALEGFLWIWDAPSAVFWKAFGNISEAPRVWSINGGRQCTERLNVLAYSQMGGKENTHPCPTSTHSETLVTTAPRHPLALAARMTSQEFLAAMSKSTIGSRDMPSVVVKDTLTFFLTGSDRLPKNNTKRMLFCIGLAKFNDRKETYGQINNFQRSFLGK